MKILQIIPSLAKGGAERLVLNICNEMHSRANVTVKLITFTELNLYTYLLGSIDYKIVPSKYTPSIFGKSTIDIEDLQREINQFQPDIIHSHLFMSEMILSAIDFSNCKYFVHFHDNMVQFDNLRFKDVFTKKKITNWFEKQIVLKSYNKKNTNFIAISNDSKQYIDTVFSDKFHKYLLNNAIELGRFNSIQLSDNTDRIVMIGSLFEKKGHVLAIETIKELHDRGLKIYLDLLGIGPKKQILQDLIDNFGLNDYIILHGNVDYPEEYLKESFLYFHTAIYEPFGLVLLEAMACGLPVVCTDAIGNRDLIVEGVNGYIHSDRNCKALADTIEKIQKDKILRERLGAGAKQFSQNFGIKEYVDSLLKIYAL